MYTCPFCMEPHDFNVTVCPKMNKTIPPAYINNVKKGVPVVFKFTIGYSGHGKTCYLSSFFHKLYYDFNEIHQKMENFGFIGLNQDTLNAIKGNYVDPLSKGNVPPPNPIMFPEPLMVKFDIPVETKSFFTGKKVINKEFIFVFYDLAGEIFKDEARIREYLPILKRMNTLVFLINLPKIIEDEQFVDQEMQTLLNTIYLTVGGETKGKNILLCFTRSDRMWGNEELYGPLARKLNHSIPSGGEFKDYFDTLLTHSSDVNRYIKEKYSLFHTTVYKNFNNFLFISLSSLGSEPIDGKISKVASSHVLDPVFWTLKFEGHL